MATLPALRLSPEDYDALRRSGDPRVEKDGEGRYVNPPIQKMTSWMPVTTEWLDDASRVQAFIEYHLVGGSVRRLSVRERITGWGHFTARDGYQLTFRVGWRADLYWITHPIENWRRHHPPAGVDD